MTTQEEILQMVEAATPFLTPEQLQEIQAALPNMSEEQRTQFKNLLIKISDQTLKNTELELALEEEIKHAFIKEDRGMKQAQEDAEKAEEEKEAGKLIDEL